MRRWRKSVLGKMRKCPFSVATVYPLSLKRLLAHAACKLCQIYHASSCARTRHYDCTIGWQAPVYYFARLVQDLPQLSHYERLKAFLYRLARQYLYGSLPVRGYYVLAFLLDILYLGLYFPKRIVF